MRSVSNRRSAPVVGLVGAIALAAAGCARVHIEPLSGTGGDGAGGSSAGRGGASGRGGAGGATGGSIGGFGGDIAGSGGTGGSGGSGGSGGTGGSVGGTGGSIGGRGGTGGTGGTAGSSGAGGNAGRGGSGGTAGTSGTGGRGGAGGTGGSAGAGGSQAGTGGTAGTGGNPDGGDVTPTLAGQIVITELMHSTNVVSDSVGEWVEVYNPSDSVTYNLRGCAIHDLMNFYTFTVDIVVPPHAFRTLAISAAGGFVPDAIYVGVRFDNSLSDQCEIICPGTGGTIIDQFVYSNDDATGSTGRSFIVDPRHYTAADNDIPANHCTIDAVPANVYNMNTAGTVFDYGTPGRTNPQCPGAN